MQHAPEIKIIEQATNTVMIAEAAEAHGVASAQIAKTLSLKLKDKAVLPAAGATHAAIRISPEHPAQLIKAQWVDVAQG
ncbi:hypothetical protein [Cupriavidus sp. YAF13]|uniref:hypothetical protein n=1 Tax=Cupriavidus sp. YAF13 TaxID=3233075 RepID=UPI003F8F5A17